MGKRGPKLKGTVKIRWSANFAYAIGLIVTDGNVSQSGSRVSFVSKDLEQIDNFNKALGIKIKVGIHRGSEGRLAYRIQFRDILFTNFLNKIGIMPAKSKIIAGIDIPDKYFFDFLRGCFDGDGSIYSYMDKRWKSSFMFYLSFASASIFHINWLQNQIVSILGVAGHVTKNKKKTYFQLKYAKADSFKIIRKMYRKKNQIYLKRKKLKIDKILAIVGEPLNARVM